MSREKKSPQLLELERAGRYREAQISRNQQLALDYTEGRRGITVGPKTAAELRWLLKAVEQHWEVEFVAPDGSRHPVRFVTEGRGVVVLSTHQHKEH